LFTFIARQIAGDAVGPGFTKVTALPSGSCRVLDELRPSSAMKQFAIAAGRRFRQRIAGMVHLQDRAVHVVAVLLHAAAQLAHWS